MLGSTIHIEIFGSNVFVYGPDSGEFGTCVFDEYEVSKIKEEAKKRQDYYKEQGIDLIIKTKLDGEEKEYNV